MSFAGKNLRYLRKQKGYTQETFAQRLGIKRSLVGAYEEERAEPRLEVAEAICELFGLSLDEFLLNDLSEFVQEQSYLLKRRRLKMESESTGLIHFVPLKAAAGYMNGYADPDFIDELNTFTLPMLAPGDYRAFEIIGDSMLPTPSGSVIVGEKVQGLDEVKNSNAYILLSKSDGIVYKRIIKNEHQRNKLTLVSDNPQYEPYTVSAEDVLEMWKAVYVLQKTQPVPHWDVQQLAGLVSDLQQQVTHLQQKIH